MFDKFREDVRVLHEHLRKNLSEHLPRMENVFFGLNGQGIYHTSPALCGSRTTAKPAEEMYLFYTEPGEPCCLCLPDAYEKVASLYVFSEGFQFVVDTEKAFHTVDIPNYVMLRAMKLICLQEAPLPEDLPAALHALYRQYLAEYQELLLNFLKSSQVESTPWSASSSVLALVDVDAWYELTTLPVMHPEYSEVNAFSYLASARVVTAGSLWMVEVPKEAVPYLLPEATFFFTEGTSLQEAQTITENTHAFTQDGMTLLDAACTAAAI